MSTVGVAEVELRAKTAQFVRDMEGSLGTFKNVSNQMMTAGKTLSMAVTAPLTAAATAGVKMSMDFESSMAKITGLVGVAREDLDQMIEPAKRMAAEYGKSANEAADALFYITSAGLRGADAMSVLDAALAGSAVGLGEVSVIADLATSAVNAYGAANLDGEGAVDILTAAVREGKLEADQLAGSMGRVLPIASSMGVSLGEVGATMAAMSRTGTGAAEAATQLRGILSSVLKPTEDANKALAEVGLSARGLREQIQEHGLLSALETLAAEFGENDEMAVRVFGNVRALSGVMDLMGENVESTREIFANMTDTSGSLRTALEHVEETAGHRMKVAFAELKLALMALGDILLPLVAEVADKIATLAQMFQKLSPEIQKTIVIVGAVAAALGPLLVILASVGKAIVFLTPIAVALGKMGLLPIAVAAAKVVVVLAALYVGFKVLVFFGKAIGTFVGLVVNGFEALVKAVLLPLRPIERLVEAFKWMYDKVVGNSYVPDMVDEIGEWMAKLEDEMVKPAEETTKKTAGLFEEMKEQILADMQEMVNRTGETIRTFDGTLVQPTKEFANRTVGHVADMAHQVGNVETPHMVNRVGEEIALLETNMVQPVETATRRVQSSFEQMAGGVIGSVSMMGEALSGLGQAFTQFGAAGQNVNIIAEAMGLRLGGQAGERQRQAQEAKGIAGAQQTKWHSAGDAQRAAHQNANVQVIQDITKQLSRLGTLPPTPPSPFAGRTSPYDRGTDQPHAGGQFGPKPVAPPPIPSKQMALGGPSPVVPAPTQTPPPPPPPAGPTSVTFGDIVLPNITDRSSAKELLEEMRAEANRMVRSGAGNPFMLLSET